MIVCDGCDRRLALAEARGGSVVERDGRTLCPACADAGSPTADGSLGCDGCGDRVTLDALRAGSAGAHGARLLCPRCLTRARRGATRRLDSALVATAVLGVVVLPVAVGLAWARIAPPAAPKASSPDVIALADHERELARLSGDHARESSRLADRAASLARELERARADIEVARGRAAEGAATDVLENELARADLAYQDAFARELAAEQSPTAKMLALWRVAETGDRGLAGLVEARLADVDPLVRARAAQVLAALGATRSLAAVVRLFGDPDPRVRRAAQDGAAQLAGRALASGSGAHGSE